MGDNFDIFMVGLGVGIAMMIVAIFIIMSFNPPVQLDQKTANEICTKIVGNESIAKSENGKLICLIPSYDKTQNIIIKQNSEVDNG